MLQHVELTQHKTHRQNNSEYKAAASGEQDETQQWQGEGPRPGKNERKKKSV